MFVGGRSVLRNSLALLNWWARHNSSRVRLSAAKSALVSAEFDQSQTPNMKTARILAICAGGGCCMYSAAPSGFSVHLTMSLLSGELAICFPLK